MREGWIGIAPLLFNCAKTVSEPHLFERLGLLFERKQIPQFVVNIRTSRKTMEPLEATRLPWAHVRYSRRGPLYVFASTR